MHPDYIRALQEKAVWDELHRILREKYIKQPGETDPVEIISPDLPAKFNPVHEDVVLIVFEKVTEHIYAAEHEAAQFQMVRKSPGEEGDGA